MTLSSDLPPLPTFLIIGAQKSATRWLRSHLGEHPDVFTNDTEIAYFNHDKRYAKGPDWYRRQFRGWDGQSLVGEATPGYMIWRHDPAVVADRIAESIPQVRLIVILRDPVERARSAFLHHRRRHRIPPSTTLVDWVTSVAPEDDRIDIIAGGWYAQSLEPYLRRFGDQLLVLLHDDVRDDPEALFATALAHIGAKPGFVPDDLAEVRFSNANKRTRKDRRSERSDGAVLGPMFSEEIDRLEELFALDLSAWRHRQ